MKAHTALNGFRDEELPLFRDKLDFLAATVSSHPKEQSFQRVVDLAGMPKITDENGSVDFERLFKIRESRETREFRDWLGGMGQATDAEITERIAGLRTLVGLKISGSSRQAIRFLTTTPLVSFLTLLCLLWSSECLTSSYSKNCFRVPAGQHL
jgi:hypothetical protein